MKVGAGVRRPDVEVSSPKKLEKKVVSSLYSIRRGIEGRRLVGIEGRSVRVVWEF